MVYETSASLNNKRHLHEKNFSAVLLAAVIPVAVLFLAVSFGNQYILPAWKFDSFPFECCYLQEYPANTDF